MRRFVDLHTHSVASDGSLSPSEVVRLAEEARLAAVALTDHDTIAGLAEARQAAAALPELRFVNGIEVSARFPKGTMHILGLGIDPESPALQRLMDELRAARDERNPRILARLQALGMKIDMEDVLAVAHGGRKSEKTEIIGRVHIAEAMRRKKFVASAKEAFDRFLGADKPAYVDKERVAPREAIAAIRAAGGLAVLAHPVKLNLENSAQVERVVRSLICDGLEGIEVYHTDHSAKETRRLLDLAIKHGLGVTGGSDFHGAAKPESRIGRPRTPLSVVTGEFARRLLGAK
jgi:predicted metal-dependent phosphoesterase TrpH